MFNYVKFGKSHFYLNVKLNSEILKLLCKWKSCFPVNLIRNEEGINLKFMWINEENSSEKLFSLWLVFLFVCFFVFFPFESLIFLDFVDYFFCTKWLFQRVFFTMLQFYDCAKNQVTCQLLTVAENSLFLTDAFCCGWNQPFRPLNRGSPSQNIHVQTQALPKWPVLHMGQWHAAD